MIRKGELTSTLNAAVGGGVSSLLPDLAAILLETFIASFSKPAHLEPLWQSIAGWVPYAINCRVLAGKEKGGHAGSN